MLSQPRTIFLLIFALKICTTAVKCSHEPDEITSLPGQPNVSFQQYAGYIPVTLQPERQLFYYFVKAETDPSSKPLVLWLNGGPGCSSVGAGAFCEHGPFKPDGNILVKNDFSWNKAANMLYLESPAGVGFSYSPPGKSSHIYADDQTTANDNFKFLAKWFDKHPEYKTRDFYITGESYGGHYVPQLANLIIQSDMNFNLKGIAIGNPLLEFNTDFNSRAEFFWSHGLISDAMYDQFTNVCNYSQIRRQYQTGGLTPICSHVIKQVSAETSSFIDPYDVMLDVCLSSVQMQSRRLNQLQDEQKIDVCVQDETIAYLNRADVQKALHARLVGIDRWTVCSDILQYEMQNLEVSIISILESLLKSGIRVLVYSGDQDSVIPLLGTRKLVDGLAKKMGFNTTVPYSAWFEGRQVAGWTQVYGGLLSYATIRGASHEAPFSQPKRSLVLFKSFLGGKPLPAVYSKE